MRILLINDYAVASGGAELQMLEIRERLRARGQEVRLFASDARPVDGFLPEADVVTRGRTDVVQALTQTVNLAAWRDLGAELRDHPPDVIHVRMFLWQLSPLILQRLADVPVMFQAAVFKAVCPTGLKMLPGGEICRHRPGVVCLREDCVRAPTWLSTMAQLRMLRHWRDRIDHVAVLSRRMREVFEADGWRDVSVLGNGIGLGAVSRPLPDAPVVGYAGRLAREKGVETLIDAFAAIAPRLPDARLLIAGTGPSEATLVARAAPLGERVRFVGHLRREQMESLFGALWVQAVPSLWEEPFGNVTTEAMARATAVIASDVGGQSDLVHDAVSGYLVPAGDAAALAARLEPLLSDRARAEAFGEAGRRIVAERHAWDPVIDRLEDAYERTVASHGRVRSARRAARRPS